MSIEIKLAAIAMYLLSSSLRRIFTLKRWQINRYWINRFKDVLDSETKVEVKKLAIARIAVDETVLKYNGRKCYLFAALDKRNKIVQ